MWKLVEELRAAVVRVCCLLGPGVLEVLRGAEVGG